MGRTKPSLRRAFCMGDKGRAAGEALAGEAEVFTTKWIESGTGREGEHGAKGTEADYPYLPKRDIRMGQVALVPASVGQRPLPL